MKNKIIFKLKKKTSIITQSKSYYIMLVIIIFFGIGHNIFAQGFRKITGTVISATDNMPIPGANVVIKGTTTGTITDANGKFSFDIKPGDILQISFVGYKTKEVEVTDNKDITIILDEETKSLDEVVVIGYGIQKKKLVTGATIQVNGEELKNANTSNALQALQGKTPGVQITSYSGQPGEGMKVIIRGLGTISGTGPLYIVDGVPTGSIDFLNNSDIESIDILKDAASSAIYGSRAANGVVLVTTKKGKAGINQVTFDAYYGIQNPPKLIKMCDAKEYAILMNEAYLNDGGNATKLPFDVQKPTANTNWIDEMFSNNTKTQNYTLGYTGGNEKSTYSASVSYLSQEGIVGKPQFSFYDRYNARFNSEHKFYNDKLKIGQHFNFAYINNNGIAVGGQYNNTLRGAFNTSPLLPMYDSTGLDYEKSNVLNPDGSSKYLFNGQSNPYAVMEYTNKRKKDNQRLVGDIYGEINIFKGLSFRSSIGIEYYSSNERSYTPIYQLSIYPGSSDNKVSQSMSRNFKWIWDNLLNYSLTLSNHKLDLMLGSSAQSSHGEWLYATNAFFTFNDIDYAYISNTSKESLAKLDMSGSGNDDRLLSYFGRIQYNYKETYLFNTTFRYDGSSKFAPENAWGFFPSFSAGWVISNENFLSSINSWLTFLKLRASWGQNGNQNIDAFSWVAQISEQNAGYGFGTTEGVTTSGAIPYNISNRDLQWEKSEQLDFGFDARIYDNFSIAFDFFNKKTKDWLIKAPILGTAGAEAPFINGGNVSNTGVELGLNYQKNVGNLNYNVSLNTTYLKNIAGNIPTKDSIIHGSTNVIYNNAEEFYRAQTGYPIGYFWGWKTDGIFQDINEVNNYKNSKGKVIQKDAKPGDVRYVDLNDDGIIDEKDKTMIGDPNPDFLIGLNISLEYKGFDFTMYTNGVFGNQIVQSYRSPTDQYANYTADMMNRWHGKGTSDRLPRVTSQNLNWKFSDLYIYDGSFLRISTVTIGYDISKLIKKHFVNKCRVYISGLNLYTFTKYPGMDPEVGFGVDNGPTDRFSSGIDLGFYPRPRTVLMGLNVTF